MVKSPAEIAYVREAARLADLGLDRAVEVAAPGVFEGDVLAALQGAIFEGGGDFPANEVIIGSGPRALLFRSAAGMRRMDAVDQLSLEWAGSYRHYHAAMMRTLVVGEASDYQRRLFDAVREATEAMTEALTPDRPVGEVDDAHRRVLDAAGLEQHRFAACGYSLGTTFSPNWMDKPMLYSGNTVPAEPGMVFFALRRRRLRPRRRHEPWAHLPGHGDRAGGSVPAASGPDRRLRSGTLKEMVRSL